MHSAPAVSYPVGRSRFHGLLLATIASVGAVLMMQWMILAGALHVWHLVTVTLWLGGLGLAMWHWWQTPTGSLAWDGQGWLWTSKADSCMVMPEVALDTQGNLLLCLRQPDGNARWVWPRRLTLPQRWLPLRRALFGSPPLMGDPVDGLPFAQDGSKGGKP